MKKDALMTIFAHCDDTEINLAGTMLKYHEEFGYEIQYVMSTNNMSGDWRVPKDESRKHMSEVPDWVAPKRLNSSSDFSDSYSIPWFHEMAQRKREVANVARELFHTVPIHLDFAQRHYKDRTFKLVDLRYGSPVPDCYDPATPTIMTACDDAGSIRRVADMILEKNPEVIFTHPAVDYTFEHTGTTLLVRRAFNKAREAGYDGSLICGARPPADRMGGFHDRWDSFIDTTGYMERKLEAIGYHACQIPVPGHTVRHDTFVAKLCGVDDCIETFTVIHLSDTREGRLTDELRKNHEYCNSNWEKIFMGPEFKKAIADYFEKRAQINEVRRSGLVIY